MFENMAIRDLGKLCRVSTRTLRYYEEIGLLKPKRMDNNYRAYDFDAVSRVEMIRSLQRSGMQLDQIKAFLAAPHPIDSALESQKQLLQQEIRQLEQSLAFIDEQQRMARLFREHGPNCLFNIVHPCSQYETVRELERGEISVLMEYDEVGMAIDDSESPRIYLVRPLPACKNAPVSAAFFCSERRILHRQRAFVDLLKSHGCNAISLIYSESCCLLSSEEVHFMWCETEPASEK